MTWLLAAIEELKLDFKISWSYKTNFFSEMVTIFILYASLFMFDSGNSLGNYYLQPENSKNLLLVGYVLWGFSIMGISTVSANITNELTTGTLEQKMMTNIPIYILLIGQMLPAFIIQAGEISVIVILSNIFFNTNISFNFTSICILIITIIGMYGIGLIFGGISLVKKKIGKVIYIFQILLLFISNTISYISDTILINKILPLTIGNDLIRKSILGMHINMNEYAILILVSLGWLLLGIFIFRYFENKSKIDGVLNYY